MPEFEGASEHLDLGHALAQAVHRALESTNNADSTVSYVVKRITGLRSGVAGPNKLWVVIDADLGDDDEV